MRHYTPDNDNEYNPLRGEHVEYQLLWASVILQAVRDLEGRDSRDRNRALNYVYSHDKHISSFTWICDELGLESDQIRQLCVTRAGRKQLIGNNMGSRKRFTHEN